MDSDGEGIAVGGVPPTARRRPSGPPGSHARLVPPVDLGTVVLDIVCICRTPRHQPTVRPGDQGGQASWDPRASRHPRTHASRTYLANPGDQGGQASWAHLPPPSPRLLGDAAPLATPGIRGSWHTDTPPSGRQKGPRLLLQTGMSATTPPEHPADSDDKGPAPTARIAGAGQVDVRASMPPAGARGSRQSRDPGDLGCPGGPGARRGPGQPRTQYFRGGQGFSHPCVPALRGVQGVREVRGPDTRQAGTTRRTDGARGSIGYTGPGRQET